MGGIWTRRQVLRAAGLAFGGVAAARATAAWQADVPKEAPRRVPVIDITDLYHPPQDPGDNVDLIAAYGLPEVDLKTVVFDVTQRYRRPYHNPADPSYDDPAGHRDPGFIPVEQLNYLFDRNVPCAAAPFEPLRAPDDPMRDAPRFQQAGIELILDTLRASKTPVDIVSFGSARPLAVACNREPALLRDKVRRAHLCAGAAPAGYLEWNVQLDVHAFVRVLQSDMPVAIYPCATDRGAFDLGVNNTYWQLPDRQFIRRMHPRLQRYLAYALSRSARTNFLGALDEEWPEEALRPLLEGPHHLWETAVWAQVAGRRLVRRPDGTHRLVPAAEATPGDTPVVEELVPGRADVSPDGQFRFQPDSAGRFALYRRDDPQACQTALREAFPALYESFTVPG